MRRKFSSAIIFEYISVLLIALIIFFPIFYSQIYLVPTEATDFATHIEWARVLLEAPQKAPPQSLMSHSAWHWAVVYTHKILTTSWRSSALIVTLASALLTVGILFRLLRKKLNHIQAGGVVISLTIVAPLAFLFLLDHRMYLGYIGINTFHNPTTLFLKPFAILQLYFSAEALQGKKSGWKAILLAVLASSGSALAKPNYLICLLPALGILALLQIWKKKSLDWKMLLVGIVLPSTAFLIWQFFFAYGGGADIIFSPFGVMSRYSSYLPIKFFLSIAFPLVVTTVYWKDSIKDIRILLGWTGFGMGAIFTYFFAESGGRFGHGNFLWSGQIALFILFVCCVLFLSEKRLPEKNSLSRWLILSSGALHLIFGILYYFNVLFTLQYS